MEQKLELFYSALGAGHTPGMADKMTWSKHMDTVKMIILRMAVMQ